MPAESAWTGTPAQVAIAALDQVSREFQVDSDRVYLTGLSMGGNGVWYLACRYPYRFAALVPICGFVTAFFPTARPFTPVVPADSGPPFEALARQLRRVPTWIVHGERSEEHTSELQSRLHLVCRLLLEKKKKHAQNNIALSLRITTVVVLS